MAMKLPKQIELAKKYFYLMMFEHQHKMPLQSSSLNRLMAINGNFEELKNDVGEKINLIIDRICELGDF